MPIFVGLQTDRVQGGRSRHLPTTNKKPSTMIPPRLCAFLVACSVLASLLIHVRALKCPPTCSCYLDAKGRRTVACEEGGMTGPLTLHDVERKVEVLKISAPESNMNLLMMSPNIQTFDRLEEIHITRSNIPILGQNFFYRLRRLEILNLSQNNISQPLDHNFRGLDKLKELYLDDNRISSLPSATFRYLKELQVLSIQRNRIRGLMPRMFIELSKLRVLKLSGNAIGNLPADVFADIKDLEVLECRACSLPTPQPAVYVTLHRLIELDLGENRFESIAVHDFAPLRRLERLALDGNRLRSVPAGAFANSPALRALNLAKNSLVRFDATTFDGLRNVTDLDLSGNRLERVEARAFDRFADSLSALDLSGNRIATDDLSSVLAATRSLRVLRLSDVGLYALADGFVPESVTALDVSGNRLTRLTADALPRELNELNASRNRLRGIDEETVAFLLRLERLRLDGNPWSCDLCHIVPLLERINVSSTIHDLVCTAPFNQRGRVLGTVQRKQLNWCGTPSFTSSDANPFANDRYGDGEGRIGIIAAGASLVLLAITVMAILGALYYSKRHAANYYTHEEKRGAPPANGDDDERDAIVDGANNGSPLFGEARELSFKFPLDERKKMTIATVDDEFKKDRCLSNGT